MKDKFSRREFLVTAGKAGALVALAGCGVAKETGTEKETSAARRKSGPGSGDIAVASGSKTAGMVAAAVGALGGMSAFVKQGDKVVIKPNAAWARKPENAATTNPEVLAAVIGLCKEAGASEVLVVDHFIDRPSDLVLHITGIKAACESAGAKVVSASNQSMYRRMPIDNCKILTEEQVIKDVLEADVFINVPIGKCHSDTKVSLGMKNMMGVIWSRQPWHTSPSVHQCIAEFSTAMKADLTILDAKRILLTNGPKGPGETKDIGEIIAGVDPVAVDAYGAALFGLKPEDVDHIRMAQELGSGQMDLNKIKILKV